MSHLSNKLKNKLRKYLRRKARTNTKVKAQNPEARLIVNKSNLYIKWQVIASNGKVLAIVTDKKAKGKTKSERAFAAGEQLAKDIKSQKISKIIFDRNWYLYHGRVKAFADWVRNWGIKF